MYLFIIYSIACNYITIVFYSSSLPNRDCICCIMKDDILSSRCEWYLNMVNFNLVNIQINAARIIFFLQIFEYYYNIINMQTSHS